MAAKTVTSTILFKSTLDLLFMNFVLLEKKSIYIVPCQGSGGYSYSYSSGAFLFSLYGPNGYSTVNMTLTGSYDQYAIYRHPGYGPTFGYGKDLRISNFASTNAYSYTNRGCSGGCSYHDPGFYLAGSMYFAPNDIEVFYETTS